MSGGFKKQNRDYCTAVPLNRWSKKNFFLHSSKFFSHKCLTVVFNEMRYADYCWNVVMKLNWMHLTIRGRRKTTLTLGADVLIKRRAQKLTHTHKCIILYAEKFRELSSHYHKFSTHIATLKQAQPKCKINVLPSPGRLSSAPHTGRFAEIKEFYWKSYSCSALKSRH